MMTRAFQHFIWICLIYFSSYYLELLHAQNNPDITPDTVVKLHRVTIFRIDTVYINWLLETDCGPAFFWSDRRKFLSTGVQGGLSLSYIRNSFWYKTGINYYQFSRNNNYSRLIPEILQITQYKDTVQVIGEVIGTDTSWITIPYSMPYIINDTAFNSEISIHKDRIRFIEIPLIAGYIFDRNKFSIIGGAGIKMRFQIPDKSIPDDLENTTYVQNNQTPEFVLCIEAGYMYYIRSDVTLGFTCDFNYRAGKSKNPNDVQMTVGTGMKISYFF